MLDAITTTQVAMLQDQVKLQSISHNVANLQTPGYKRQLIEHTGFDEQLQANINSVSEQVQESTQMQQGAFVQSRHPSDLAISGDGYFEVQTDEGLFYTRRGDFHVDNEGTLSTPSGAKLRGQNGIIRVDDNPFTIDASGSIYINKQLTDRISIMQFSNKTALINQGHGLYQSQESPQAAEHTTRILQGFLEQSNVKSVDEMMEMVKTTRHFEATQRVMRTAHQMLSTAISSLGDDNV